MPTKSMILLREFISCLKATFWRGLVLVHSFRPLHAASEMLETLLESGGRVLVLALSDDRKELKSIHGSAVYAGFMDVEKLLGSEYDHVVILAREFLRPNIVAASGEMVRAGGTLTIIAPPQEQWQPGIPGGRGAFKKYLLESVKRCKSLLWMDFDSGAVIAERRVEGRAQPPPGPEGFKSRRGVPKALSRLAANIDQASLLEDYAGFMRGRDRCFVVIGDRGRGKSGFLGLALALAVYWHLAGPVEVVAPTPYSVSSLFKMLVAGLRELGVKHRVVEKGGVVLRVQGPWFKVFYESPASAEPGPLVVIDEAAAVGVARVRRLVRRSGKSVVATTVHGYEGSGRTFTQLLLNQFPQPMSVRELKYPIRYMPGDPLEEWLYNTFMLRAEPQGESVAGSVRSVVVDPHALAADRRFFESLYSILVLAHYRNQPDDLLLMLDAPHHELRALVDEERRPVAVAEVSVEEPGAPQASRLVTGRLSLYSPRAESSRGMRIVRIAVAPSLQRRGFGSRLLASIEEEARARGFDWVGSIFSRHDVLEFWLKNGYKVFYVSPRFNRVTGEKNVAVVKPVSEKGGGIVSEALKAFKLRLLLSSHSIYRDLAAEKITLILLSSKESVSVDMHLTSEQKRRLNLYLQGRVEYETAHDAIFLAVINKLARTKDPGLDKQKMTAITARVLQGKTIDETASIIGIDVEKTRVIIDESIKTLLAKQE